MGVLGTRACARTVVLKRGASTISVLRILTVGQVTNKLTKLDARLECTSTFTLSNGLCKTTRYEIKPFSVAQHDKIIHICYSGCEKMAVRGIVKLAVRQQKEVISIL